MRLKLKALCIREHFTSHGPDGLYTEIQKKIQKNHTDTGSYAPVKCVSCVCARVGSSRFVWAAYAHAHTLAKVAQLNVKTRSAFDAMLRLCAYSLSFGNAGYYK